MRSKLLWAPFISLLVVWLVGVATLNALSGFINLLLVLAFMTVFVGLVQDCRNHVVTVEIKI